MSQYQHPMRKAVFHAYHREDGKEVVVRAVPYGLCPMWFKGTDRDEVMARAEAFRDKAVRQNEAAYASRKENAAKARAKRKAKEASE